MSRAAEGEGSIIVKARIPAAMKSRLEAIARQRGEPECNVLGELIAAGLGKPPVRQVQEAAPREIIESETRTPLQLFEAGWSVNAIAAKTRLPYRDVMKALGRSIDALRAPPTKAMEPAS